MAAHKVSELDAETPGRNLILRLQSEYKIPTFRFQDAGILLLAAHCDTLERRIAELEKQARGVKHDKTTSPTGNV
jgi:hypothetical protein